MKSVTKPSFRHHLRRSTLAGIRLNQWTVALVATGVVSLASVVTAGGDAPLDASLSRLTSAATVPGDGEKDYFVALKAGAKLAQLQSQLPLAARARAEFKAINTHLMRLPTAAAAALKADPHVLFIEEDGPMLADFGPLNDPPPEPDDSDCPCPVPYSDNLKRMNLPHFPIARLSGVEEGKDIDIAVLDSGIDPHEDLNVVVFFSNFTLDPSDEVGHGTRVAGIIGAYDNGIGATGVASGARLWNVKVGNAAGVVWSNLISGMDYVHQNADTIEVANISLTNNVTNAPISSLRGMMQRLVRAGVVVVTGAGNLHRDVAGPDGIFGNGDDSLPGSLAEAMNVSGMDAHYTDCVPADTMWIETPGSSGSNFSEIPRPIPTNNPDPTVVYPVSPGGAIDVAAPAKNVFTTLRLQEGETIGQSYGTVSGTSAAAPHVAGLVALHILANGRAYDEKGVYKIRQAIIDESQRLQPQSAWATAGNTLDTDGKPEPLAYPSEGWIPAPVVSQSLLNQTNQQFAMQLAGSGDGTQAPCSIPGYVYRLRYTEELGAGLNWQDVPGQLPQPGTGAPLYFFDAIAPAAPSRFYQVVAGPENPPCVP